ncbi:PaaI family thioesterase [Sphingopyxis sp. PET50]|uniref:PaaI family thioesterase n=1 Tax=Sphingopyxis sp. PET50 TaxID=2976533 RepID=UPI0021AFD4E5|nr:PaaI family thioesterase [Sphingopyxis sp. PET50]
MAAYALVLAHIGPVAMAVTSGLNYQFLRPCRPGPLFADASMLRLGKRLAVMDVRIWTDDPDKPVGQANVTYAIP